jgi:two-component system NarL family response regulator
MDLSRNLVAGLYLDRLFHEIVQAALADYGWRLLDPRSSKLHDPGAEAEIILVGGSGPVPAVVDRLRRVRAEFPASKVVVLGATGSDTDLVRFIAEGARACVLVSQGLADLVAVLEMIRENRSPSSGRITQLVIGAIHRLSKNPPSAQESGLTRREAEIFRLIQDGLSNKEIATQLRITPNTVKNHVHRLLEKLKVRSRHEAAWLRARQPRPEPARVHTGTDE